MKFETPIEVGPKCGEYVALDQTQRECAHEHRCGDRACPLGDLFDGHEFVEGRRVREGSRG